MNPSIICKILQSSIKLFSDIEQAVKQSDQQIFLISVISIFHPPIYPQQLSSHPLLLIKIITSIYYSITSSSMQGPSVSAIVNYDTQLLKLYTIHKKISNGSFGTVFQVTNKQTNIKSALKVELIQPKVKPTLKKEIDIMKALQNMEGVPKMYASGKTDKLYYLQLELLDRDLSVMVTKNIVTPITYLCELTIKVINILQSIHAKGIMHRDLKPQNIMLQGDCVYLIDFGISEIMTSNPVKKRAFVGTPRYASLSAHKGCAQAPTDEIESLLYIIIYIFKRTLPWMDIAKKQNKMESILEIKQNISKQDLCKGLPTCFLETFNYISEMQKPFQIDYNILRDNFIRYLQETVGYNISHAKEINMSIPHPDTQTPQYPERRRFSQIDPQVLGLLLKQRQLRNGGKRQSIQSNFLTVPESQHEIKTSSVLTVELVTTQKAVASESREEEKEKDKSSKKKLESIKQIAKQHDKATVEIVGEIDQQKSYQEDIDAKMKNYCIDRRTRGSMRSSAIKLYQFQQ